MQCGKNNKTNMNSENPEPIIDFETLDLVDATLKKLICPSCSKCAYEDLDCSCSFSDFMVPREVKKVLNVKM